MSNVPSTSIQNSFIGGLKTEATGLNFPENACTDTQNCVFTLIGDVLRREGIDFEANYTTQTVNRSGKAISSYVWANVGGDGQTKVVVVQVGGILYFYQMTAATTSSPLSTTLLASNIPISSYLASGSSADPTITECQYADGNGYLFVYHPNCDPFVCTFLPGTPNTVTASVINVQVRDFVGVYPEPGTPPMTFRPTVLNNEHNYNLQNQGWTDASAWTASETNVENFTVSGPNVSITIATEAFHNVGSGLSISVNDPVSITVSGSLLYNNNGTVYGSGYSITAAGVVTAYSGTTLTINVTSSTTFTVPGQSTSGPSNASWTFSKDSSITNTIGTWNTALANYPSNTDIWFSFKNTSNVFAPATTVGNVALSTTPAPRGHFIIPAFNQNKTAISGVSSITSITTTIRPRTGTWFQGRTWYAGVDATQNASGDAPFYTWTENIYFSQIITDISQAGYCYQTNDPTAENLFDLLPTDGGVITIQGSGAIYKLFPIQNGMLVFAANGVWFITGSQGIGFSASDYTVTKISGVQSTSSTSFVNVQGFPVFWNEEGIYACSPGRTGAITVDNLCLGTILTFYSDIPLQSKKFARGDYNQVSYEVQWTYRSTNESSVTDRYQFDRVLILNTITKAFYYYTISGTPYIHDIKYIVGPGGSTSPLPVFKYLTSYAHSGSYNFTFSEERDYTHYVDWFSYDSTGVNYVSYFVTGYKLDGKAISRWQPGYIYMFLRNEVANSYKIQGLWEFAITGNSGKWSTVQVINDTTSTTNFGMIYHRHKIRGHGLAMQIKVQSVDGKPFDIMGWSVWSNINASV
jgi:hypothetical protein